MKDIEKPTKTAKEPAENEGGSINVFLPAMVILLSICFCSFVIFGYKKCKKKSNLYAAIMAWEDYEKSNASDKFEEDG